MQKRFAESFELYEKVLQNREKNLGQNHQDTIKTARDIETIEGLIAEQNLHGTDGEL